MDNILPRPQKPEEAKETPKPEVRPKFSLDVPPDANNKDKPAKKRRVWLIVLIVLLSLFFVALAAGAGAYMWYKNALEPYSSSGDEIEIEVTSGSLPKDVADELQQKNVIKSSLAMQIYMRINNMTDIYSGTYYFAASQPVSQIVEWLNEGNVEQRIITILPGLTLSEIRQELIDYGFSEESVDEALNKDYDSPLLADRPADASLEGYIYPETYYFDASATPEDVIMATFDEFESLIEENDLRQKLADRGFDLYEGITLASIVVKEASSQQDQEQVAQVFEKRLAEGMKLESDVTYHYAAELLGVDPAVDLESPYNTRLYAGLPPGPIANFYIDTLEAVAEPASGDYLYFVAGDDGTVHYAYTYEEHEQNIELYCHELCSTP